MSFSTNSSWGHFFLKGRALTLLVVGITMLVLCLNSWTKVPVSSIQNNILRRSTGTSDTAIWQPKTGVKWQIQLENAVEDIAIADIFDIDLFDNTAAKISEIHKQGAKVICYFSAGTYEDWRTDANKFTDSDFGSALEDWPGERWLNLHSSNVRKIMQSRLDQAKQKGCDGVDPDNIDAYGNDNGLDLTEADSIDYLDFLASEAHSRGLSIGLKNGGDIIPSVIEKMQWSVNEQCAQYDECDVYAAFTDVGKPVFHIEYADEIEVNNKLRVRAVTSSQKSAACDAKSAENFSTVIKNMELDAWVEYC
ncbi:putative endo alpha-1,4 polygalactosaminidase [Penicillium brasilianum]|uniref:alpha-galactosidase n=1 Tax=Penicillium brasilianum TaxID=104259 RepID=A0A1S9RTS1_PENBI|nr:putative endo alpha-1,4 polygalactosaminidase [Penicillium brasilianum]